MVEGASVFLRLMALTVEGMHLETGIVKPLKFRFVIVEQSPARRFVVVSVNEFQLLEWSPFVVMNTVRRIKGPLHVLIQQWAHIKVLELGLLLDT